jgi:hypothetical protein
VEDLEDFLEKRPIAVSSCRTVVIELVREAREMRERGRERRCQARTEGDEGGGEEGLCRIAQFDFNSNILLLLNCLY